MKFTVFVIIVLFASANAIFFKQPGNNPWDRLFKCADRRWVIRVQNAPRLWYYDKIQEQCLQLPPNKRFIGLFRGFETKDECERVCTNGQATSSTTPGGSTSAGTTPAITTPAVTTPAVTTTAPTTPAP